VEEVGGEVKNSKDQRACGVEEWLIEFRRQRRRIGLTLPMLEKLTGVCVSQLHRYETGEARCPADRRMLLEDALRNWAHPRYRERIDAICELWSLSLTAASCMSGVAIGTLHHILAGSTTLPRAATRAKLDAWLKRWECTLPAADAAE
jgi:hypothetical protein